MKKSRIVALILAVIMICAMMSGCVYAETAATFNKDGTGKVVVTAGMERSTVEAMMAMGDGSSTGVSSGSSSSTGSSSGFGISFGSSTSSSSTSSNGSSSAGSSSSTSSGSSLSDTDIFGMSSGESSSTGAMDFGDMDLSDATLVTKNGYSYYVVTEEYSFSNSEEFESIMSEGVGGGCYYSADGKDVTVYMSFNPSFYSLEENGEMYTGDELTDAEFDMLAETVIMEIAITLPSAAYIVADDRLTGYSVEDNTVRFDLVEMGNTKVDDILECVISTNPEDLTIADCPPIAVENTQTVLVDGKPVTFETYALEDENGGVTNYIKLRDLAYILNGTAAQFEVSWDGAINIISNRPYTSNGSEMHTPFSGDREYRLTGAVTKVDGKAVGFNAICLEDDNGGEYNYYRLRDLGEILDFDVSWTYEKGIFIETDQPYTDD